MTTDLAVDAAMLAASVGAALNLALGQSAVVAAAGVLAWRGLRRDAALQAAARSVAPVLAASMAFLAACALSSLSTRTGWPGAFESTRWRPLLAIPVGALALALRGPRLGWWCGVAFAVGCGVHGAVGVAQALTGWTPLADLLQVPWDRRHVPAPGQPHLLSAVGLFYNRVRLSHVLAAGAAVAVGLAWGQRRWRGPLLVAGLAALAGLVATYGRGALVALVAVLAGAGAVTVAAATPGPRRRMRLAGTLAALAVVVAGVLAVPSTRQRFLSVADISGNQDRLFLWGRGVEMAMDHAPAGTGFGGYAVVRDAYYDRWEDSFQSRAMSHNLVLSLLAETGFLGLLGWLWMWWVLLRGALRGRGTVAVAGLLGAATFHVATGAHDPLYQSECALAWALCAVLMTTPAPPPEPATPSPSA